MIVSPRKSLRFNPFQTVCVVCVSVSFNYWEEWRNMRPSGFGKKLLHTTEVAKEAPMTNGGNLASGLTGKRGRGLAS